VPALKKLTKKRTIVNEIKSIRKKFFLKFLRIKKKPLVKEVATIHKIQQIKAINIIFFLP